MCLIISYVNSQPKLASYHHTHRTVLSKIYMLFTGCEVRMRKTVPELLKTARARRARDVFKTEGTVFLIRTEAAGK